MPTFREVQPGAGKLSLALITYLQDLDSALISRTAVYAIRMYGGVGLLLPTSII